MGRPKKVETEIKELKEQHLIETQHTNQLIADKPLGMLIIFLVVSITIFFLISMSFKDTHDQISDLDERTSIHQTHLELQNLELQSRLISLEKKLDSTKVPFCKAIGPNGQIGVGINASKLNETCQ